MLLHKKNLIAVDGSDNALKAIEFASVIVQQNVTSVHLLHVVKQSDIINPITDYIRTEDIKESTYILSMSLEENQIIAPAIMKAKEQGIQHMESTVIEGDPVEEIINYAKNEDVDMIIT